MRRVRIGRLYREDGSVDPGPKRLVEIYEDVGEPLPDGRLGEIKLIEAKIVDVDAVAAYVERMGAG